MKAGQEIPSWLFFGILAGDKKWSDEKQKTAEHILKSLKNRGEFECWPEDMMEKILYFNKHDNCAMYSHSEPKKKI